MAATVLESSEHKAFKQVINGRYTCKKLSDKPIPQELVREVLSLTRRAPSSFNSQPYKVVVVQAKEARDRLSEAMMGPNAERVKQAPCVAVFCADTETVSEISKLQQFYREHTHAPAEYFETYMPKAMKASSNGFRRWVQPITGFLARLFFGLMSLLRPAPEPAGATAWSYKQTAFAADHFCLAATSLGLGSSIMEGLDGRRVRTALSIPSRYAIPCAVAIGYPAMENRNMKRYDAADVFYQDTFASPFQGLPEC